MESKVDQLPQLELCVLPQLLSGYSLSGKCVIVVNVLRTTSTIITALAHGVKQLVVADSLEKCLSLGDLGFITAGTREGEKLPSCRLNNSPQEFISDRWRGEKIVITSNNGAHAILAAKHAKSLLLGAFLNLDAVVAQLRREPQPLLILCAGKQDRLSPEDILFAGALCKPLEKLYRLSDEIRLASQLYDAAEHNLLEFLSTYNHSKELKQTSAAEDITFCLQRSRYDIVPHYSRGYIEIQNNV